MSNHDIKISGELVASPSKWEPGLQDLVTNSTRVGSGKMRFNFVATKRTWSAEWTHLSQEESQLILNKIEGVSFFTIECFDPGNNEVILRTFYKSDRSLKVLHTNSISISISVSFIEQ